MTDPNNFAKLVPGFDFLQGLMGKAGTALPDMGQWIAPSLDPVELEKRIEQLKTVQFWLEQNARMISATIQALEVQRMTLSTLQSMNLPMADLASAFRAHAPEPAAAAPAPAPAPAQPAPPSAARPDPAPGAKQAGAGAVDPMQWWGALTQQFGELATKAVHDLSTKTPPGAAAAAPGAKAPAKSTRKPASAKAATKSKPARKAR